MDNTNQLDELFSIPVNKLSDEQLKIHLKDLRSKIQLAQLEKAELETTLNKLNKAITKHKEEVIDEQDHKDIESIRQIINNL